MPPANSARRRIPGCTRPDMRERSEGVDLPSDGAKTMEQVRGGAVYGGAAWNCAGTYFQRVENRTHRHKESSSLTSESTNIIRLLLTTALQYEQGMSEMRGPELLSNICTKGDV
jgi:hypothetical protein